VGFLAKLGTGLRSSFSSVISFTQDAWSELKKVRWPNRKELTNYTIVVMATVIFVTLYFVVLDLGITQIINLILGE
jgi:preprotein translocase subunit SecE